MMVVRTKDIERAPLRIEARFGVFDLVVDIVEDGQRLKVRLQNIDKSKVSPHPSGIWMDVKIGHRKDSDKYFLRPQGDDWICTQRIRQAFALLKAMDIEYGEISVWYYAPKKEEA